MKAIVDRFTRAPYGFIEDDVEWLVAKLFRDGDIALFINSEAVSLFNKTPEELVRYITRKEYVEKLMTEKKEKPGEKQIKAVRDVMKRLFNVTSSAENDDDLMKSFLTYAKGMKQDLEKLEIRYQSQLKYPGRQVISEGKKLLNNVLCLDYAGTFFKKVFDDEADYMEFAEDYEPLKTFFEGEQKTIFDKSLKYMAIYDDSKTFIVDKNLEAVVKEIKDILKMERPYGFIYKLPDLNKKFEDLYADKLEETAKPIYQAIMEARTRVMDEVEGKMCEPQLRPSFVCRFDELQEKAKTCNNVANLQSINVEVDALKTRCLQEIADAEPKPVPPPDDEGDQPVVPQPPLKVKKVYSIKAINASTSWQLETEEDVDCPATH